MGIQSDENKGNRTLIFFTASFPYRIAGEQPFISPELKSLSSHFDKVVLVPLAMDDAPFSLSEYENVRVDMSLAVKLKDRKLFYKIARCGRALFSLLFLKAFWQDKGGGISNKVKITVGEIYRASEVKKWLSCYFDSLPVDEVCILYTYWFDFATLGCAMFRDWRIKNKVTRAHGFDVYDFRVKFRSAFLRKYVLSEIGGVYVVSDKGKEYLWAKFPDYQSKIHRMYLGIHACSSGLLPVDTDKLSIFSCSFMNPVKRNDLLASYIIALARAFPSRSIVWTHAGGGPLFDQVKNRIEQNPCTNLEVRFLGSVNNKTVLDFYSGQPVDVFVSLSESEGIPVSMMEAQAFGIPVVATGVGGIPEIVTENETGFLLSPNPDVQEFINKMSFFFIKENASRMRVNSYMNWMTRFNAGKNHENFALSIQR
ncbi:MAG: glycosyltransferase [Parabacteroides sp.]|nr:glycosyltransferase [Parabacteroides sp.]